MSKKLLQIILMVGLTVTGITAIDYARADCKTDCVNRKCAEYPGRGCGSGCGNECQGK